jgi:carbamoylphosphate synthase large subunit
MSQLSKEAFLIFSGYNQRAVIALCRKLKQIDIQFYIIATNKFDSIFFSDYSDKVKAIRNDDILDIKKIIEHISSIKRNTECGILTIAPSSEYLNHFLLDNHKELEEIGCRIPLVAKELYDLITNKFSFSNLCLQHGVAVPQKVDFNDKTRFPFVAKPIANINNRGKSLYPYIFNEISDVASFLEKENKSNYYFEEYIIGESYYLLLHISKDKSVKSFSQKNILQQADGKSIILAEPADIHTKPSSLKIIEMLQAVSFYGLIMIEVRKINNKLCVIEANPRLWGPLQLLEDNSSDIMIEYIYNSLQIQNGLPTRIRNSKKHNYFWFNGLIEMIVKKKKIKNHTENSSMLLLVIKNIMNDVYLRKDSFNLFYHEFRGIVKG